MTTRTTTRPGATTRAARRRTAAIEAKPDAILIPKVSSAHDVTAYGAAQAAQGEGADWKAFNRQIHQFSDRWRNAGHLSEKQFAELQPQWKDAIHGARLPVQQVVDSCDELLLATRAQRAALPFMHPGRVDVIGAGALVWRTIVQRVTAEAGIEQTVTSEKDILDGIALSAERAVPPS